MAKGGMVTAWHWTDALLPIGCVALGWAARSALAIYWRRDRVRELVRQRASGATDEALGGLVRDGVAFIEGVPSDRGGSIRAPDGFAQPITLHGRRYLVSVRRDDVTHLDSWREQRGQRDFDALADGFMSIDTDDN